MDVLISLIVVTISQHIRISNHHTVHLKSIKFLCVNYTSIKLGGVDRQLLGIDLFTMKKNAVNTLVAALFVQIHIFLRQISLEMERIDQKLSTFRKNFKMYSRLHP